MGLRGKAVLAIAVFAVAGGHAAVGRAIAAAHPVLTSVHAGGTLDCAQLERLWESAGGDPASAFMAAEIATAESSGNQYAVSKTDDVGYWQINEPVWGTALATTDPLGNARAAVYISHNGTDWYPWTTYTSGAYAGRC